ncbi:MAG: phage terminase large subunit [Planctomycetota bacterium]
MPLRVPTAPVFDEFCPLPGQHDFVCALWRYDYLLYAGGYGSGKSLVGCYVAILLSLSIPGNFGCIARRHGSDLRDSTRRTFFECLPPRWIDRWRESDGHLRLTNGSEIIFRHLDDPTGLKSVNLGWAYIDEITDTSEAAFRVLQSRLRLPVELPSLEDLAHGWPSRRLPCTGVSGRKLFATSNTDAPGHWVHELWFGPPPPRGRGLPSAKRFVVHSPSHANTFLPAGYLADMDASFDPRYHERYVQGKWVDISRDRVYHQFDRAVHVRPVPYDRYLPLVHSWDFNVNPMATVILQRAGDEVRVIDEIVLPSSNTPEVCAEFLRRYSAHATGILVYGDATGHTRGATTGASDYSLIRQCYRGLAGLSLRTARSNTLEVDRVNAVNARLRSADGRVSLVIDPRCVVLVRDLEQVHYKPASRSIDRPGDLAVDKGADPSLTHVSDALGYYIAAEFPVRSGAAAFRHYNVAGI